MLWYILTEPHACGKQGCLGRVVSRHHKVTRPMLEKWDDKQHKVWMADLKQMHNLPKPDACLKPITSFEEVSKDTFKATE